MKLLVGSAAPPCSQHRQQMLVVLIFAGCCKGTQARLKSAKFESGLQTEFQNHRSQALACELDVIIPHGSAWVRASGELRPLAACKRSKVDMCYFLLFERRSDGCRPDERRGVADMLPPPSPSLRMCAIRSDLVPIRHRYSHPPPPHRPAACACFSFGRSRWRVHAQGARHTCTLY